jgi:hypothetical protein
MWTLAGEGELKREGACPLSRFLPPFKQRMILNKKIKLFERGIQGGERAESPVPGKLSGLTEYQVSPAAYEIFTLSI